MALIDLSLVTSALKNLLEYYFPASGNGEVTVSTLPPDKVTDKGLGLYLYHVTEESSLRNMPPPGSDSPPVAYTPMALNLFYQLSPHTEDDALLGQTLMGVALKALHDHPVIDDSTNFGLNKDVFPLKLRGGHNRLRIALLPTASEDATHYGTAGSSPLRLAAYYQVSVVLLEPEEPKTKPNRVLTYGVHAFVGGAPRLDGNSSTVTYLVPDETKPRETNLSPAQATFDGTVTFTGSGLGGDSGVLLLASEYWAEPMALDSLWAPTFASDRLSVLIKDRVTGSDGKPRLVFPGVHGAVLKVTKKQTMSDGSTRESEYRSNESPFLVVPRIDSIVGPADVGKKVTVNGRIFANPSQPNLGAGVKDVQVFVADSRLAPQAGTELAPGEFKVANSTRIDLKLPAGLKRGVSYPLRIFVNGAESAPRWVRIPKT